LWRALKKLFFLSTKTNPLRSLNPSRRGQFRAFADPPDNALFLKKYYQPAGIFLRKIFIRADLRGGSDFRTKNGKKVKFFEEKNDLRENRPFCGFEVKKMKKVL
jgi:hypothetical protein